MKILVKYVKNVVVGFFGLMVMGAPLYADPVVTQDPTGTFDHGGSVSLQGTGFGLNSAVGTVNLQYIGDNIEAGVNGAVFNATNWGVYQTVESKTEAVPRYSQTQAHSGNQSVVLDYTKEGELNRYKGHFYHDHGSMINRLYLTFWVWAEGTGVSPNQWKIWRIKNDTNFTDSSLDFIQNCWPSGMRIAQLHTVMIDSFWDCNGCEYEKKAHYLGSEEIPGPGAITQRWVRMEYWIDVGTIDTHDGTFFYKLHDPNHPTTPTIKDIPKLSFDENLMILKTEGGALAWKALLFGGAAVDGMDVLTYWDDIFIQVGSWARIEIGDAPTWSACTHREIQMPTSWNDNSITFNFKQGSFLPGDHVYVFVVDENGMASAGKGPITVGGTVESSPLPQAVQGFQLNE